MEEYCRNCKFSIKLDSKYDENYACRRYPPKMTSGKVAVGSYGDKKDVTYSSFTTVYGEDWCGEFKAKVGE